MEIEFYILQYIRRKVEIFSSERSTTSYQLDPNFCDKIYSVNVNQGNAQSDLPMGVSVMIFGWKAKANQNLPCFSLGQRYLATALVECSLTNLRPEDYTPSDNEHFFTYLKLTLSKPKCALTRLTQNILLVILRIAFCATTPIEKHYNALQACNILSSVKGIMVGTTLHQLSDTVVHSAGNNAEVLKISVVFCARAEQGSILFVSKSDFCAD
ncbi:unnamed protein product [Ceratitis capitata]|uniref:(Mediterranean fruit fly) hypothetical protein n=1 Tax=Ceratitis capitata TaxID=7213 RepID=A0A811U849_CERCA|nr:unnamed protein product [Ceratitis capitata]